MRANERLGETIGQMQNLGVTLRAMQDMRSKFKINNEKLKMETPPREILLP